MVENPNIYIYILYVFVYPSKSILYSTRNLCLGTFNTVAGLWRQLERTASRAGGEPSDTCIVDRIVFWGVSDVQSIYISTHTYIYIYIYINTYIYLFICVFFSGSILEVGYHLVEPQCSWDFGEVSP